MFITKWFKKSLFVKILMYTALLSLIPYILFSVYFLIEVKTLSQKMIKETSSDNILQTRMSLEERTQRLNDNFSERNADEGSRQLLVKELLDTTIYGNQPAAIIIDTHGRLMAKSGDDLASWVSFDQLQAHYTTMIQNKSGTITLGTSGEKVHLLYMTLDKTGWLVSYVIPESQLRTIAASHAEEYTYMQVYKLVQRMSFFLFIGILLILFFSYFFSEFFTQPIRQLRSALCQRAKGIEIEPLHTNRLDEMGELIHTFNDMDMTIQNLIDELNGRSHQLEESVHKRTKELQEANELLSQTYSRLKRTEKSRTELIAHVSHDLKTPLTSIKGFLEVLNKYSLPKEQEKELIDQILVQTNQIIQLIEGLFELSSFDVEELKFQKEYVNIEFVLEQAIKTVFPDGEHTDLILKTDYEDDLPLVYVDPKKIYRVFINILNNAVKYSANRPKVIITMTIYLNHRDLVVKIQDNGMGIEKENIDMVFIPYYREARSITREIQGSGLGLSISKKIIEAHDGDIFIESEVNHGTTIYILLPAADPVSMTANR